MGLMYKENFLQMTIKEIELFLNNSISNINFESVDVTEVKEVMINNVKTLFVSPIKIQIPYYTNREIIISLFSEYSDYSSGFDIIFKVTTKKTNKTKKVSKLRKKYVHTIGKFKFDDMRMSFYNPHFEALDLDNYLVKLHKWTCSGNAQISLKHRKEKLIDILNKDLLWKEIEAQDDKWKDIRKKVILNAATPKLKKEMRYGFTEADFDYILLKTEENNKELIDSEIEKIFKFLNSIC